MNEKDVKKCHKLVNEYLKKFDLAPIFSVEEFAHWFVPRANVVDSFVVDDPEKGIIAFCSFYTLPSTVMHHPTYKSVRAAYSYYNVPSDHVDLTDLVHDALVTARDAGYDVFNALDLMDNMQFLNELKFGVGDGHLQYYLFNYKCPHLEPKQIALVLQ
jgi:glycylpeptide N-tetradecanoyltransferase